jgi:hypothetical protein
MFQVVLVDALPGSHATLDGGPGCFGAGLGRMVNPPSRSSVRRMGVIFCKPLRPPAVGPPSAFMRNWREGAFATIASAHYIYLRGGVWPKLLLTRT